MKVKTKNDKEFELVTSWDDGCSLDLHLAELLEKYHLPAIFYIPTGSPDLKKNDIKKLSKKFDIGGHTISHRILRDIPPDECYCELRDSREQLQNIIGREVSSLCYPRGRYNVNVKRIAKDIGYREARTTKVLNLFKPTDLMAIETSVHVCNRREYKGVYWLNIALDLFDKVIKTDSLFNYFHLWGHSWEVQKFDCWKDLEFLFSYIHENIQS